jgi:hypothetical protein
LIALIESGGYDFDAAEEIWRAAYALWAGATERASAGETEEETTADAEYDLPEDVRAVLEDIRRAHAAGDRMAVIELARSDVLATYCAALPLEPLEHYELYKDGSGRETFRAAFSVHSPSQSILLSFGEGMYDDYDYIEVWSDTDNYMILWTWLSDSDGDGNGTGERWQYRIVPGGGIGLDAYGKCDFVNGGYEGEWIWEFYDILDSSPLADPEHPDRSFVYYKDGYVQGYGDESGNYHAYSEEEIPNNPRQPYPKD